MMILGILAATMVTTLKPAEHKKQAFATVKKKLYMDIDNVISTIQVECAKNMDMTQVYDNCDRTQGATHSFGGSTGLADASIRLQDTQMLAKYMRGTVADRNTANGNCAIFKNVPSLKLKNGACLYVAPIKVGIDVNGNEGPNEMGMDRMRVWIDSQGITTDMDMAAAGLKDDGTAEAEWAPTPGDGTGPTANN